jgi:hypothetical protein
VERTSGFLQCSFRSHVFTGHSVAEADGNRTRLGALAPTPVLKTGGPTRRPDASPSRISARLESVPAVRYACPAVLASGYPSA